MSLGAEPTVTLWRCDGCGKWSHAQRRPASHFRSQPVAEDGEIIGSEVVVCGPFLEYAAVEIDAPGTRDVPPRLGERIDFWPHVDDPNEGIGEGF